MKRVVFLVDMNAFYISCETTRRPELAGIPAAVAGDPKKRSGIILAANYEARKYGVKTTMTVGEAQKRCPEIILVPPDHSFYEEKSRQVMELLSGYTPIIEQASIDEAWLDMTGCEILSGQPRAAAERIMADIRDKLDLMCSIGISENKFLAKMAAEMKKPMGITELWVHDVPEKLWPLDVKAMYGIGNKTAQLLANLNIRTIGELAKVDPAVLSEKLGKFAFEIHQKANGIDNDPVTPHSPDEMKSIGRSTTLPEDITDLEEARKVIMELSEEIAMSARRHNKKGRTVQITIKYSDFKTITRQTRISPTNLARDIMQAGFMLLEKNWNRFRPVRLLGISISGFEEDFCDQVSLFEQANIGHDRVKEEKLERTLDQLRLKYGLDKISRAALIKRDPS
ncbi:DNA polymerase IV [Thermoclostridium caenicola]|uniref:DNA polymerase IV n=1 Tax=Thermoclostridium caenicola TaxID=659425 RepID=A0A1M6HQ59_9FIRM|nr:DNA polymerase IV [Thermoclostridium caenicola]SHJ24372.1 DNA polymerase-4 [Thermoclostridium caenicola]